MGPITAPLPRRSVPRLPAREGVGWHLAFDGHDRPRTSVEIERIGLRRGPHPRLDLIAVER